MNLLMYIDFVAPIIVARRLGICVEEASEIVKNSLSDETLNALTDEEKEWLFDDECKQTMENNW